jgi:hypothetical protein
MAFDDSWLECSVNPEYDDEDEDAITVTSQITAAEKDVITPFVSPLTGGEEGCRQPWPSRTPVQKLIAEGAKVESDEHNHAYPLDPVGSREVRMVDKDTGGVKGSKPERYDLIPVEPLRQLAEHFGRGAEKYESRNWERGYAWSLTYAALQRHANAYWGGEDIDPESGSHHMVAVAWHALALVEFARTHKEKDDRP